MAEKAKNGKGTSLHAPAIASGATDAEIANYVRTNGPRLVTGLSYAASRAGEQENWAEMQGYIGIANQLGTLCGFDQMTGAPQSLAVAAGAAT